MATALYDRLFEFFASRQAIYGLVALLAGAGLLLGLNHLLSHPTQSEAAEIVYDELLRYEKLHGDPHVIFHDDNRIYFDELKRDYKYSWRVSRPAGC